MKILHTEASGGLGGQELRILHESIGMRERGHEVILAIKAGGGLAPLAKENGLIVYELPLTKSAALFDLYRLVSIIRRHRIDIVNTHSSWDAWLGGVAARLTGRRLLRTRHLSTKIRPGINSKVLYNFLADQVVTTCQATAEVLRQQATLSQERCRSIPTGVHRRHPPSTPSVLNFRAAHGLSPDQILIGTVCVLRSWKGVQHLLAAAKFLEHDTRLHWMVVGDGPSKDFLLKETERLGLTKRVTFTGYQEDPSTAMAAMDIFALLSSSNEGVSQAVLQAAHLGLPLITTETGGLAEVCLDGYTGFLVPVADPQAVASSVKRLADDATLRQTLGKQAQTLVNERFTLTHTLDAMEQVYGLL